MAIGLKTTKLLWGRAANRCSICHSELTEDAIHEHDDDSIVGEMAHIIARKEGFTRGDYEKLSAEDRDKYSNLILLCRKDHKKIDDQPAHFTVEELRKIKTEHEQWVKKQLGSVNLEQQRDDETYAGIVDEWCRCIDIDYWTVRGTHINSASGPSIDHGYHQRLTALPEWILSRVWPRRYPKLEAAFFNFSNVLQDFLAVLNRYLKQTGEFFVTDMFYKIKEWDAKKYKQLYEKWDEHVCLVWNLFTELTRAANLVCHRIRQYLFHGFRLKEGVLLVQRDMVDFFKSSHFRAEYKGAALEEDYPYKRLVAFEKSQYHGDYVMLPEHLKTE